MQRIWGSYTWKTEHKAVVYITFDDGPHPLITPFVLKQLEQHQAQATFFCIGNNVSKYPDTYRAVQTGGHTIGNHTYDHKNGWKTSNNTYIRNTLKASQLIDSRLFRPPYGRIKNRQAQFLIKKGYRIIMWSLLTGDFDLELSPEDCLKSILDRVKEGDIIVFHDSEKAWERLEYVLPRFLEYCKQNGWAMKGLSL